MYAKEGRHYKLGIVWMIHAHMHVFVCMFVCESSDTEGKDIAYVPGEDPVGIVFFFMLEGKERDREQDVSDFYRHLIAPSNNILLKLAINVVITNNNFLLFRYYIQKTFILFFKFDFIQARATLWTHPDSLDLCLCFNL